MLILPALSGGTDHHVATVRRGVRGVKRYSDTDQQSMNSWIEGLLDVEDMRRRCEAHDKWLVAHPQAGSFAVAWADRNLDELADR